MFPEQENNLMFDRGLSSFRMAYTLGTRGFSRVRREFSVLAEGRHIFGRKPKPRNRVEKCLAPRVIGCDYLEKCPCILFMFTVKLQPTDNSDPVIGHQTCSPGYFTTETFYFYRPVQTRNLITGR